jgi:hypothetical protein
MSSLISKVQTIMNMKGQKAYEKYKFQPQRGFSAKSPIYHARYQSTWEAIIKGKRERSEKEDDMDLPPPKRKEHPFEDMVDDEPHLPSQAPLLVPSQAPLLANEWCALQDYLKGVLKPRRSLASEVDPSTLAPYQQLHKRMIQYVLDTTDANPSISSVIDHLPLAFPLFMKSLREHKSTPPSPPQVVSNLRKVRIIIEHYQTEHAPLSKLNELVDDEVHSLGAMVRSHRAQRHQARELYGIHDVFSNAPQTTSSGIPSLASRLEGRWMSHGRFMSNSSNGGGVGDAFVAFVDGTIPQRKETFQYLNVGQAPYELVSCTTSIPSSQRYYLSYRESRGAFNMTQTRNKTGSDFSSEVANN